MDLSAERTYPPPQQSPVVLQPAPVHDAASYDSVSLVAIHIVLIGGPLFIGLHTLASTL